MAALVDAGPVTASVPVAALNAEAARGGVSAIMALARLPIRMGCPRAIVRPRPAICRAGRACIAVGPGVVRPSGLPMRHEVAVFRKDGSPFRSPLSPAAIAP